MYMSNVRNLIDVFQRTSVYETFELKFMGDFDFFPYISSIRTKITRDLGFSLCWFNPIVSNLVLNYSITFHTKILKATAQSTQLQSGSIFSLLYTIFLLF